MYHTVVTITRGPTLATDHTSVVSFQALMSMIRRLESRYLQLLEGSSLGAPRKIRHKAMKYILIGDDMFYRTLEGLLLK
jgi:hypothetical protein